MKYKVVYSINTSGGGNPDGLAMSTFYKSSQAILSAQEWVALSPGIFEAYVWDGIRWQNYT